MRRRDFITLLGGAAVAWPLAARAQQSGTKRIGVLVLGDPTSAPFLAGLQSGLRDLGYSEGHDIQFEVRSAHGHGDDLAALAAELVTLKVDVIVAYTTLAAWLAKCIAACPAELPAPIKKMSSPFTASASLRAAPK